MTKTPNKSPDNAALAFTNLQPEHILEVLESLSFRCDGRFLALNSYENRVYQVGIEDGRPMSEDPAAESSSPQSPRENQPKE